MNSAFLSKFIQIVYCIFENYLYYFSFISDENSVEEEMFCSGESVIKPGYKKFSYKNIYDKHTEKLSPTRKRRLSKAKSTPVKVKKQKEEVEIIEITSSPISVSSAEEINTAVMNYFVQSENCHLVRINLHLLLLIVHYHPCHLHQTKLTQKQKIAQKLDFTKKNIYFLFSVT